MGTNLTNIINLDGDTSIIQTFWNKFLTRLEVNHHPLAWECIEKIYSEKEYNSFLDLQQRLDNFFSWKTAENNKSNIKKDYLELEMTIWCGRRAVFYLKEDLLFTICNYLQLSDDFINNTRMLVLKSDIADDLDKIHFGSSSKGEFDLWQIKLQKQYSWMPKIDFIIEEKQYFSKLLNKPSIYLTEFFIDKFEQNAQNNLKNFLKNN